MVHEIPALNNAIENLRLVLKLYPHGLPEDGLFSKVDRECETIYLITPKTPEHVTKWKKFEITKTGAGEISIEWPESSLKWGSVWKLIEAEFKRLELQPEVSCQEIAVLMICFARVMNSEKSVIEVLNDLLSATHEVRLQSAKLAAPWFDVITKIAAHMTGGDDHAVFQFRTFDPKEYTYRLPEGTAFGDPKIMENNAGKACVEIKDKFSSINFWREILRSGESIDGYGRLEVKSAGGSPEFGEVVSGPIWYLLVDAYYHLIEDRFWESVDRRHREKHKLFEAFGIGLVDNSVFSDVRYFGIPLAVFRYDIERPGNVGEGRLEMNERSAWVLQGGGTLRSLHYYSDSKLSGTRSEFLDKYGYISFEDSDFGQAKLDQKIHMFSGQLQSAHSAFFHDLFSDALLRVFMGFDSLCGGSSNITKNVSERIGALVCMKGEGSFKESKKKLKKLYDSRSKLVHEAVEVSHEESKEALRLSGVVLDCLLVTRNRNTELSWEDWVNKLGVLVANLTADESIPDALKSTLGVGGTE